MSNSFREAIQQIFIFLSAFVRAGNGTTTLVHQLHNAIPSAREPLLQSLSQQSQVVLYSLDLLQEVNSASLNENIQLGIKDWRQVNALIEITLILGLYRVLSPGVGVPENRRIKSVLLDRERSQYAFHDQERMPLLQAITSRLEGILVEGGEIGETLKRKHTIDILSGMVELSYNPLFPDSERKEYEARYKTFLLRLSPLSFLANLTSILHPQTPPWLRAPITRELSSVPLQSDRHGVRTVVQFLLGKHQEQSVTHFEHIAKVVGSPPSWMTADVFLFLAVSKLQEYIQAIAQQVIDLLDEKDPLLQNAGAHIVSFMSMRQPSLVEKHLLAPIRSPLLPTNDALLSVDEVYSNDESIARTLQRVETITSNHLPSLISSLLQPILLNLFLLACYTHSSLNSKIHAQAVEFVRMYFALLSSTTTDALDLIGRSLYLSEYEGWTYSPGDHGGIAIFRVTETSERSMDLDEISKRVSVIVEVLGHASNDIKSEVFVDIVRHWLSQEDDPLWGFANIQMLQLFISKYQSDILKSPVNVVQVCGEMLSNYAGKSQKSSISTPSIYSLAQIVQPSDINEEGDEFVQVALDLLSAITAESTEHEIADEERQAYEFCLTSLEMISKSTPYRNQSRSVIRFIHARLAMSATPTDSPLRSETDRYNNALRDISDPLVPVRAQGISILRDLILQPSPIIDTDTVLELLIGLLQDEDSFVYLNAIKAIEAISDIHGEYISYKILDLYESHPDVDVALRLAEALTRVVRRMGELFTGEFARLVISRCMRLVEVKSDWRIRVSALGVLSVCVEIAPLLAEPVVSMALHLFKMNDITFAEEDEAAAPLRRAAVSIIAGVLQGGGIDGLCGHTRDVIRSIRYLTRSDRDEIVRELAREVEGMLGGAIEVNMADTKRSIVPKIQEL